MIKFKKFISNIRPEEWFVVGVFVASIFLHWLLSYLNHQSPFVLKDQILATADQNLIGGLLFVYLPTTFSALWISKLVYYAYLSLAFIIGVLLVWLLLLKKGFLVRVAITAFIFSYIFSYPLFYLMPCQTPGVYFVLNEKNIAATSKIQAEMDTYKPSEYAANKIERIAGSEKGNTAPISCFPSVHAIWSIVVIYFLARISRYTILLSVPWLFLNLAGGLYFAQHYLVDYIAAIPIAMISISCAYWLLKTKKKA